MSGPWMQTRSGRRVDIVDPLPEQIELVDICYALARLPRYTGHTFEPWTVAQHSALVLHLLEPNACLLTRVCALAHDFHEGIIGDLSSPMKRAIRFVCDGFDPVRVIEERIDRAIRARFGLPDSLPKHVTEAVHRADMMALGVEKSRFMLAPPAAWIEVPAEPTNAGKLVEIASVTTAEELEFLFGYSLRSYHAQ